MNDEKNCYLQPQSNGYNGFNGSDTRWSSFYKKSQQPWTAVLDFLISKTYIHVAS